MYRVAGRMRKFICGSSGKVILANVILCPKITEYAVATRLRRLHKLWRTPGRERSHSPDGMFDMLSDPAVVRVARLMSRPVANARGKTFFLLIIFIQAGPRRAKLLVRHVGWSFSYKVTVCILMVRNYKNTKLENEYQV